MKTNDQRMKEIYERADEKRAQKKARQMDGRCGVLLSLVLALNLVLFLPYPSGLPDISAYSGSEYYPLMQQLNALTYRNTNTAHNNFEAWFGDLFSSNGASEDMGAAPESPGTSDDPGASDDGDYNEVTDNQEADVIEGDLFKRTSTHFFYVGFNDDSQLLLSAFTIDKEDSACCGTLAISAEDGYYFSSYYGVELYLSEDGDTATIFTPVYLINQINSILPSSRRTSPIPKTCRRRGVSMSRAAM